MRAGFIIVGVMKSGTTTLAHHLHQHREIAIPRNEVHYFDYDWNFAKGVKWYEDQLDACATSFTKLAGEKTPYSFYDYTAERMAAYNPDLKLVWIFRNPVDRAYSNYNHDLYNIDEWRSFEKCIKAEESRTVLYQYLSKGRYVEQVDNFLRFFPKEQMLFVTLEDLLENPQAELPRMFSFLGIGAEGFEFKPDMHSKKSLQPSLPKLLYFYRKFIGEKGRLWNYLWRKSFEKKPARKMDPETRKFLLNYYSDLNRKLAERTGLNLSKWTR